MKVKATKTGYYNQLRKREGDVFILNKPEDFSKNWMIELGKRTVEVDDVEIHPEDDDHLIDDDVI